jgi:heterodisulfide reductase subunit A-like polyferredoxin
MRGLASVLSLVLLAALPAVRGQVAPTYLYRDVAIIGGGAAGAYSAIAAKQDYGLSVVVIEKTGELVSHSPETARRCGISD